LAIIDQNWKEHLRSMDDLRSNVQFAAHEQKDPLLIYKFESYKLFSSMVARVNQEVTSFLMKCQLPAAQQPSQIKQAPAPRNVDSTRVQTTKPDSQNLAERSSAIRQAQAPNMPPVGGPPPRPETFIRQEAKVGRNDLCPCGSGKKFKNCHGQVD
ncbi:MAG: preprotein translocase subunit SecA, partial [Bacteroidota bacterium]